MASSVRQDAPLDNGWLTQSEEKPNPKRKREDSLQGPVEALEKACDLGENRQRRIKLVLEECAKMGRDFPLQRGYQFQGVNVEVAVRESIENFLQCSRYITGANRPGNGYEAIQQLMLQGASLTYLYTMSSDVAIAVFGVATLPLTAVAAVALAGGAALSVKAYKRKFPVPLHIDPLSNYSREVFEQNLFPLVGRDTDVEKIFRCWISCTETNRQHPLIVGKPGVGKTRIIMEVARRIATSDLNGPFKPLGNLTVFGGSATSLLPSGNMFDAEGKFEAFISKIQPIKHHTVVALDEIHSFLKGQNKVKFEDALKSLLDTSPSGLPYTLSATTVNEYRRYIKPNEPINRRFKPIFIEELDKSMTLFVLRDWLHKEKPSLYISEELLENVYNKTKELAGKYPFLMQPQVSNDILSACITKLDTLREVPQAEEELKREEYRLSQMNRAILSMRGEEEQTAFLESEKLERKVKSLQGKVKRQKKQIEEWKEIDTKIINIKREVIKLAVKVLSGGIDRNSLEYKSFVYDNFIQLRGLEKQRESIEQKNKMPKLDNNLLTSVLNEFKASLEEAQRQQAPALPPAENAQGAA